MKVDLAVLRRLHRIHRQLTDLRERLARGPQQIRGGEAHLARSEEALAAAKKQVQQTKIAADQRQLQLREREARVKDLKFKLNAAASNREYQALRDQIAADEQANNVLSDEILELLEKVDQHQAAVAESEKNLGRAREELAKVKQRVQAEQQVVEADMVRVQAEQEQAEADLPDDFRADVQRLTKSRGEQALAPVDGEVCGACSLTLTANMLDQLKLQQPVFCKNCGALLYFPEGRTYGL